MAGTIITTWTRYDLDNDGKDDQIVIKTPVDQTQADRFSYTATVTYAKNPSQPKIYPINKSLLIPLSPQWKITGITSENGKLTITAKTAEGETSFSIKGEDLLLTSATQAVSGPRKLNGSDITDIEVVYDSEECRNGITTSDLSQIHLSRLNLGGTYPVVDESNPNAYPKAVEKTLNDQLPRIYDTYEKFESCDGDIRGTIDFNMDIGPDGFVKQASGYPSVVTKNKNITPALIDIIASKLQVTKFPTGGTVMVAFSVSFD